MTRTCAFCLRPSLRWNSKDFRTMMKYTKHLDGPKREIRESHTHTHTHTHTGVHLCKYCICLCAHTHTHTHARTDVHTQNHTHSTLLTPTQTEAGWHVTGPVSLLLEAGSRWCWRGGEACCKERLGRPFALQLEMSQSSLSNCE